MSKTSKRRLSKTVLVGLAFAGLQPIADWFASAIAQAPAESHLKQVIAANSLVESGNTPFHLQMSFQYDDLNGKPAEVGTLEEWWVSADKYLVMTAVPSVNDGKPMPLDDASSLERREVYALHRLLEAETRPVPGFVIDTTKSIAETHRSVGHSAMTCFILDKLGSQICVEPKSEVIALKTESNIAVVMRNTPGTFEKTKTSSDIAIVYGGHPLITGHLRTIEVFDALNSNLLIPHQPQDVVRATGFPGVVPGKLKKKVEATFPQNFEGGFGEWSVYLSLHVMKDGSTAHVFAVSSPTPTLTKAAISAIEGWKFEPFTYEGNPVEVEMAVEVKFSKG